MPSEELGRVLQIPLSCSHCPKYSDQPVAFVIDSEKVKCPDCGGEIDLTTKEWFAFRRSFPKSSKNSSRFINNFRDDAGPAPLRGCLILVSFLIL